MTVAEIKEYIDELKSMHYIGEIGEERLYNELQKIKSMLDELEPNENTSQWVQHYEICGYVCDNCGHISEIKDNVCSNCGAIMNDELKENNK